MQLGGRRKRRKRRGGGEELSHQHRLLVGRRTKRPSRICSGKLLPRLRDSPSGSHATYRQFGAFPSSHVVVVSHGGAKVFHRATQQRGSSSAESSRSKKSRTFSREREAAGDLLQLIFAPIIFLCSLLARALRGLRPMPEVCAAHAGHPQRDRRREGDPRL